MITGAGSGIGRATAIAFARSGAQVVAIDFNAAELEKTRWLLEQEGKNCHAIAADVSREAEVADAIGQTVEQFGRLDVLHNNAGISILKLVTETTESELDRLLGVNFKGVFFGCKYAIPPMLRQGGGVIINTASELAIVAQPLYTAYCATKGAVLSLTRALAVEWAAQGIRVNAICPGPIDTPMLHAEFDQSADPQIEKQAVVQTIPVGRLGVPEEIADVAVFLASDEARFMHGAAVTVDGGKTAL
jgi:3-oxoacyl-[acyl-carrier protein] reductase